MRPPTRLLATSVALLAGCARPSAPLLSPERLPFVADTLRTTEVAPGLTHHFIHTARGPWAIHLLEVRRSACWSARAVKGGSGAAGRRTTSALLRDADRAESPVYAGVNADFFSLATGVPVSAHVEDGRVVVGPGPRPAIAFDSLGVPTIAVLSTSGSIVLGGRDTMRLVAWNRHAPRGVALFDRAWGTASDTGTARIEVALAGPAPYRVVATDTLPASTTIPDSGLLLVAGPQASAATRRAVLAARVGDMVQVARGVGPRGVRDAVGGWPILLRDGAITTDVDSAGASFAPVRHPRTAIGLADGGRTLLLMVVDGRQPPWSAGMTLRELAELFRALGAHDALNLDGGGSSAFVTADPDPARTLRVRNRPSDAGGERTVGNALAIVRRCERASSASPAGNHR